MTSNIPKRHTSYFYILSHSHSHSHSYSHSPTHTQTHSDYQLSPTFSDDTPMAVDEFTRSVQAGLQLSKRISYGKDKASMTVPKAPSMKKSLSSCSSSSSLRLPENHRPTAPMVYAVISDPSVVDNPDICSYQPYVYGHCDPPALVPLHMHGITMEVDCYLDTAFVTVTGTWRVHCVTSMSCCDCRIAIPMGDQVWCLCH